MTSVLLCFVSERVFSHLYDDDDEKKDPKTAADEHRIKSVLM